MDKHEYLVGWCPDCGRLVINVGDDETCDCGHRLLSLTACEDANDVDRAVPLIEDIMRAAFKSYDFREERDVSLKDGAGTSVAASERLSEEDGGDKASDPFWESAERELYMALLELLSQQVKTGDKEKAEDEKGDLYRFMVAPSPYPVYVRGDDRQEATEALQEHLSEFALAGFEAALEDDEVGLTLIPLSGNNTYHHFPDWASNL